MRYFEIIKSCKLLKGVDHVNTDDETDEARTARVLKEIANSVQDSIVMEEDHPSRNSDNKLPILDMKVWLDQDSYAVYQHYEKPVANRQVISMQSAQSSACKRSVHVNEVLRRILNTSARLDWSEFVAPALTDYMARMKVAGYDQHYRKKTLEQAIRMHDRMVKEEREGDRPVHRPRDWQAEERRKAKRKKKHSWATKGGCIAPIIIPSTPNSELLQMLREVAQTEAQPGLQFRIIEKGGRTVKRATQKSNPTATGGCAGGDCLACKGGRGTGGPCRKSNILYEIGCRQCPEDQQAVYLGETARNLYTRGNTGRTMTENMLNRLWTGTKLKNMLGLSQTLQPK